MQTLSCPQFRPLLSTYSDALIECGNGINVGDIIATTFSYNGIEFDDIQTMDFTQTPEFTDDNTTYLWDKIHIKINAYLNIDLLPSNGTETPADIRNRITKCLGARGKTLIYTAGSTTNAGTTILNIVGPDPKAGPFPGAFSVKSMPNATWQVEYEITTYVSSCCGSNNGPTALIANRWTDSATIDLNMYTTWTRKGKLYFRYDLLAFAQTNPDQFRELILASCPLKAGFVRTKMNFTASSDWLQMDYDIQDREVYALPIKLQNGGAITDWSAHHDLSSQNGGVFTEDITIELTGNKLARKSEMYAIAAFMVVDILGIRLTRKGKGARFLRAYKINLTLNDNKVSVTGRTQGPPRTATIGGLQVPAKTVARLGSWTGLDNQVPDPGSRGTARLAIIANIIGDPCILLGQVNGGGGGIFGGQGGGGWTPQIFGNIKDTN